MIQLALYRERGVKARRIDAATRIALALPARLFDSRDALVAVRRESLIRLSPRRHRTLQRPKVILESGDPPLDVWDVLLLQHLEALGQLLDHRLQFLGTLLAHVPILSARTIRKYPLSKLLILRLPGMDSKS
jgi:hypothetical protein